MTRGNRRRVVGVVVSDRMDKSVVVEVKRLVKHPLYKKYIRRRTRLMAHDEENAAGVGDRVELMETRPLSKRKSWRVVRILEKAPVLTKVRALEPTLEEPTPEETETAPAEARRPEPEAKPESATDETEVSQEQEETDSTGD
ncbi:MAG: hypothetical protein AMS16_00315 [Planctomycetes bacterium DG_58]|nr:MAG: hypothetical protein AMS16_00315 [Planctomycetes bacterium DG_58]